MKTCPKCEKKSPDNSRFCSDCGTMMNGAHVPESEALVIGSGSAAQHGGISAGAGGIAIRGNIYIGPPPNNLERKLEIYCSVLAQTCSKLPMRGKDVGVSDPTSEQKPFGLVNVYIDLDTKTQVDETTPEKRELKQQIELRKDKNSRPISALEVAIANRRAVLLGDPGGGKTTFVNYMAYCLAMHLLEPNGNWLERFLPSWKETNVLPVTILLRDFARTLPSPLPRSCHPKHLMNFMAAMLDAQNMLFALTIIEEALENGRALILFDGLDEVPTSDQRMFVRDAITVFCERYPANRFLATCRVLSYQPPVTPSVPDLRLDQFSAFELAPFDDARIDRFIDAWYHELGELDVVQRLDADDLAKRLREVVRRPDLWRIASNPLLLTVIALVDTHKGRLPGSRALLYEETVDILLWRWEQIKAGGKDEATSLRQLLWEAGRTDVDLKKVLWFLAFDAHGKTEDDGDNTLADIGELHLQKTLAALKRDDANWARQVIVAMKLRAGVLIERTPEVFSFPHRTFQEYLASAYLSAQANFAKEAGMLAGKGALWREVILLAVGRLVYLFGDTDKPLALVGELCAEQPGEDETSLRKEWLAGEVLNEIGGERVEDSRLGRDLLGRVRKRMTYLLASSLPPRERIGAGDTLARLGDPRPGVGLRADGLPDIEWCDVPAFPSQVSSQYHQNFSLLDKFGHYRNSLPSFRISRYPVTNAQYAAFVEDGGYTDMWRRCWTDAGWKWKGKCYKPATLFGVFELSNHPVVGVSWYEAIAFCRWLTERLKEKDIIRQEQIVKLPSESEWEMAARGKDGRIYPWGNVFDPNLANCSETGINATSAVGCFYFGASPYGVLDMCGNIREWCSTKYLGDEDINNIEKNPFRVLRGSMFDDGGTRLHAGHSNWDHAAFRHKGIGFRVVLSL